MTEHHHFVPTTPQTIVDYTMTALFYRDISKHWFNQGQYERAAQFLFQASILRVDAIIDGMINI